MKTATPKHQTIFGLLTGLILLCLPGMPAAGQVATPDKWDGTTIATQLKRSGDTILIATAAELAYFAQQVNNAQAIQLSSKDSIRPGDCDNEAKGFYLVDFALTNDIDLDGKNWTPIGTENSLFKGHFDGRGHCVSGLMVNVNENNNNNAYAGLFGNAPYATFKNLGVRLAQAGVRIEAKKGNVYAGGLAAVTDSVYNCYVEGPGTVEAVLTEKSSDPNTLYEVCAGGIAGELNSNARAIHCYSTVDVKAEGPSVKNYAGGIAGQIGNSSLTSNTYATGTVEAVGTTFNYAGGIVGSVIGSSSGTFEYNLALNDSVKGSNSNRMVGDNGSNVTFSSNYASPDMLVNDTVVSDESDKNGSSKDLTYINLNDTLKKIWKNGWTFPADGYLPQLMLRNGDKNNPTYVDWPATSPQPFIDPIAFLPGKIVNSGGGKGTSWSDSILIADRAELAYLAKQVNAGKDLVLGSGTITNGGSNEGFQNIYFALSTDIDLSKSPWTPIGTADKPFKGNFDGRGHSVKELNVKIDASDENVYAGLFGNAQLGTLRNLGVSLAKEGVSATGKNVIAGGLAGSAEHIRNCFVTGEGEIVAQGSITSSAGGIVGVLTDSLTHCYATVGVKATGAGTNRAGGIAAQSAPSTNILAYTYATGTVEASLGSENIAGGICGQTGGTLSNSLALNGTIAGGDGKSYRIAGNRGTTGKLFSNFASTKINLNASAADSLPTADRINGADTWLETIQKDLIPDDQDSDNGWVAAWEWPQNTTSKSLDEFLLPQLKITEGENNNPYFISTPLTGQPEIEADSLLTTSESSPLILGVHIAEGDSVYLAYDYDTGKWLYTTSASETPNIPFNNGTVKGSGCPVFIVDIYTPTVLTTTPDLLFDSVNLELNEACLTVNSRGNINLFVIDNVTLANKSGGPAIVNNGKLTIKSNKTDASLSVLSPDTAIRNTGTLILEYKSIHLAGGASTVFNKEGGSTTYFYPMVEWQFDSNLQDKVLEWESNQFKLPEYATGRSFATTSVTVGTPFGLKAGPSDGSSAPVTQQGQDSNGSYTTSFTATDKLLTVYTHVKNYLPPPPPPVAIYYTVALPAVEGAATKPGAGNYTVEEGYNFRFYLTLDSAYNLSKPVVTTDRGETITPRVSDGAYVVRNVYEDVQVSIGGIVKNGDPVANETIQPGSIPQIWAKRNTLYIRIADEASAEQPDVRILTATGNLYTVFKSVRGLTYRQLPAGLYIVQVGKTVRKVIIR